MASLAMALCIAVSMSSAARSSASPIFLLTSSVRVALTASFAAPLRMLGASQNAYLVARASPQGANLEETVQHVREDVEELCKGYDSSGNCAIAWDEVEELAAAVAHKRVFDEENKDPLEAYCKEVPEADECKKYED